MFCFFLVHIKICFTGWIPFLWVSGVPPAPNRSLCSRLCPVSPHNARQGRLHRLLSGAWRFASRLRNHRPHLRATSLFFCSTSTTFILFNASIANILISDTKLIIISENVQKHKENCCSFTIFISSAIRKMLKFNSKKAHIIFDKFNRKTWFVKNRCGQSGHGHFGHFHFRGVRFCSL